MSHRTDTRRPWPHRFWEDLDTPGTCRRCHLLPGNSVHTEQARREQRRAEREAEKAEGYVDPSTARRLRDELDGRRADE